MDKHEAAQALGVAYADVVSVEDTEHGTRVVVRDGGTRLIRDDGHFAVDEHPATAHLRRFEPEDDEPAEPGDDEPEAKPAPKPRSPRSKASK